MKDKFKRIFDTFKNKKKCHYLLTFTLESLMHLELKENIIKCLNDKIGLSLFQMEWMVMRANQYFTILINDPLIPIHVVFNKTYLDKYSYDCSAAKTTHHFYHPLEVLCTECGFCSYEEIGNILLSNLLYTSHILLFRFSWVWLLCPTQVGDKIAIIFISYSL